MAACIRTRRKGYPPPSEMSRGCILSLLLLIYHRDNDDDDDDDDDAKIR